MYADTHSDFSLSEFWGKTPFNCVGFFETIFMKFSFILYFYQRCTYDCKCKVVYNMIKVKQVN